MLSSLMIEKQGCRFMIHQWFHCRSLHPFRNTYGYLYQFQVLVLKPLTFQPIQGFFCFNCKLLESEIVYFCLCLYGSEDNEAILDLSLGTTITNLMTTVWTTCASTWRCVKYHIVAWNPSVMWNNNHLQHQMLEHLCLKKFIQMITSAHCVLLRERNMFMNASEELAHRCEYK